MARKLIVAWSATRQCPLTEIAFPIARPEDILGFK
jgi:hypothetical protein